MKCPECGNELTTDNVVRSAPVDSPQGQFRHFHVRCAGCGAIAWYTTEPGSTDVSPRSGAHDCAFFRPQAS